MPTSHSLKVSVHGEFPSLPQWNGTDDWIFPVSYTHLAVPLPDTALPTGREKEKEAERKQPVRLTHEVRTFLQKQYDFRYNLLTEERCV